MADNLELEVVSPAKLLLSENVTAVTVPGREGNFTVMGDHAPVMSVITPGTLRVLNDGSERRIFVNGGFADVTPEGLTVLAEDAVDLAAVNAAELDQQVKDAQDDLRDANSDAKRDSAKAALERLEAIRVALKH